MNNTQWNHLVLWWSWVIWQAIIKELQQKWLSVKALERTKTVEWVETINVDLLEREKTIEALVGTSHVYLSVGLQYSTKIWKENRPIIVQNVIDACTQHWSILIFTDNVYMYGPGLSNPFDEEHEQSPSSNKGAVRKHIANMILDAHRDGKIKAVIGRAADFYGPHATKSAFYVSFIENIVKGKDPQWIGKRDQVHTFSYTEDVGKGLVRLALDESSYGQAWHLPAGEPITMQGILDKINTLQGTTYKLSYPPRFVIRIMALFMPMLGELMEMMYQFDKPYVMSWKKFQDAYPDFKATSYEQWLKAMVESFQK